MGLSEHEKWIRDNLGEQKVQVDSNELWKSLQSHVPPKKNRKGLIIWICIGLIVGAASLSYLNLNPEEGALVDSNTVDTINQSKINQENSTPIERSNSEGINIENEFVQSKSKESFNTKNQNSEIKNLQSTVIKGSVEAITTHYTISNPMNILNKPVYSIANPAVDSPLISTDALVFQQPLEIEKEASSFEDRASFLYSKVSKISTLTSLSNVIMLNQLVLKETTVNRLPSLFINFTSGTNVQRNQRASAQNDLEYDAVINKISNTRLGFFSALGLSYELHPKWSIYSNLQYTSLVDQIGFSYTSIEELNAEGVAELYITKDGLVQEIEGQINVYTISDVSGKWHQYTSKYDLQLGAKYQFLKLGRWNSQIGVGIAYSVYSDTKGSYLSNDFSVEKLDAPVIVAMNKINSHASLQLNYSVNKKLSIGLFGQYNTYNNQFSHKENKLNSEYQIGNIGLTCRYGIL